MYAYVEIIIHDCLAWICMVTAYVCKCEDMEHRNRVWVLFKDVMAYKKL